MAVKVPDRIINSVLDNDKYNFGMGDFLYHKYKGHKVKFAYKCRTPGIDFTPIMDDLTNQFNLMGDLRMSMDEAHYLNTQCGISAEYVDVLLNAKLFDPSILNYGVHGNKALYLDYEGVNHLDIYREVTSMAVVSQLLFTHKYSTDEYAEALASGEAFMRGQIEWLIEHAHPKFNFTEFGTRRRFSAFHQEKMLLLFKELIPQYITGTSNVHLAMKHGLKAEGTMAHLLLMFMQSIYSLATSQIRGLEEWAEFKDPSSSLFLTDTLGDKKWDRDFSKKFMEMYLGQRHDSGNPFSWGRERLSAYSDAGIDTSTKKFMFSDSLDFVTANELTNAFSDDINVGNGIGTFCSNSMNYKEHKAVSQVIKMMWANGQPLVKLSADEAKAQCECMGTLAYAKTVALHY